MDNKIDLDRQQSSSAPEEKKKGKNQFQWFRNYKTFTKFGKKSGLFSKDRTNVEFLVLNDFELTR